MTSKNSPIEQGFPWRPVSEYRAEMGSVVAWLAWPKHDGRRMDKTGMWVSAYTMDVAGAAVWVEQAGCSPMESAGRRVTHFVQPPEPSR